ncbi:MAG: MBL fold metallo-hydrolase [Thaumarchaeota archaeon]|nr:MBL fold metallo-hydrolase [Nitrososphaerota archaeon]
MRITQLYSASVIIEDKGVKVLCDPWLLGEEYFGSWGMYPPYQFRPENFKSIDFIYISHIHPDHCSLRTLDKLDKNIPVLIHNFPIKFLKNTIEKMGFTVIELEHNLRTRLRGSLHINILAGDNCNPEICGKLMGCVGIQSKFETAQIDTIAVMDNEKQIVVNVNDCPLQIGESTATQIKQQYKHIDALLLGYSSATSYPQCYELDTQEKIKEAEIKQKSKLETAKRYIEIFEPKFYIPFAGRYTLAGKNYQLNKYRGEPELEVAFDWFVKNGPQNSIPILLNYDSYLDLDTGTTSEQYIRIDEKEKERYGKERLASVRFDYENEQVPSADEIYQFIPQAYEKFEKERNDIGFTSDVAILLPISDTESIIISRDGTGFKRISSEMEKDIPKYIKMTVDPRLLKWLLQGPKKANWSTADIGSHIWYKRVPNTYHRGLFRGWNHFYSGKYQVMT